MDKLAEYLKNNKQNKIKLKKIIHSGIKDEHTENIIKEVKSYKEEIDESFLDMLLKKKLSKNYAYETNFDLKNKTFNITFIKSF